MTTPVVDRHIACDAIFNLRDLGGYPAADGRRVRWRTLFRADGLHRVTPDDGISRLGWRTVLDLRTRAERDLGAYACEGVDVVHLPVLRETWETLPREVGLDDAVSFLATRYLDMAEEGGGAIATAFEILASPGRLPAVFHCSAGKDRTGVLAALVLATLGVDDDDIVADYALSERAMTPFVAWLTAARPELVDQMAQQPKAMLACPPAAMGRFIGSLRERYGSTDGYLSAIGVSADTRALLRESLLET